LKRAEVKDPSQSLHIGDSYSKDFMGAKSAGMNSLLLQRDGNFPSGVLEREIAFSLEALLRLPSLQN